MSNAQSNQVNMQKLQNILHKCPELRTLKPPGPDVEVLETMGKGNYGYVYRGRIKPLDNVVSAIKVVYIKESELKETWQEVEILRECNHPNIVKFYAAYLQGLNLWIAMEYCGGSSVDTLYNIMPKPLTEEAISCIMHEAMKGLSYFHETNHIHRDIKAGNLLLTEKGEVKLADFGVSSRLNSSNLRANSFIGTPFWMAPEVIRSENDRNNWYDYKADIWSMGITVIELADKAPPLADIHPFTALKLVLQDSQRLGLMNPKKRSKQMNDFIQQCLTRDPNQRPSAKTLLKHPFLVKANALRAKDLIADLVEKAKTLGMKMKTGQRIDEDYDDDTSKYQVDTEAESFKDIGDIPDPNLKETIHVSQVIPPLENQDMKGSPIIEARHSFVLDEEVLCCDFLGSILILGTDRGLLVADLSSNAETVFVFCIRGVRFRQIAVIEDYDVMVAICGKNDHVRQYRIPSLNKLIRMALNGETLGSKKESNFFSKSLQLTSTTQSHTPTTSGSATATNSPNVHSDLSNPLEDFIKIPSTKDSTHFVIERTAGSIFLLVLIKHDMILYEWAKAPYLRFMKVKAFWLPEQPKFLSIFHDGFFVRDILVIYTHEANLVNVEDAKVTEISVAQCFKQGTNANDRWRTFDQLPIEANVIVKYTMLRTSSVNRKLAAAVSPYQDGMRPVPSTLRQYLATFGKLTHIVDMKGDPLPGTPSFHWTATPTKLLLVPSLYIIAVCENSVEICDMNTGEKLQVIQHSAAIKFLCDKHGRLCVATGKKRKNYQVFILGATPVLLQQLENKKKKWAASPSPNTASTKPSNNSVTSSNADPSVNHTKESVNSEKNESVKVVSSTSGL